MLLKFNLFLALFLAATCIYAAHVTETKARQVASIFLNSTLNSDARISEEIVPAILDENGNIVIYAFKIEPVGFILLSADDASFPILGYSFESNYDLNNQPGNFKAWLEGYNQQISAAIQNNQQPDVKTVEMWNSLQQNSGNQVSKGVMTTVSPLLTSTWDQGSPYNYLCPSDAGGSGGHVWAGCVATAMSQVANYWRWPLQGEGSHGYYSSYGYLSADYGSTTYKWEEMTNASNGIRNFEMAQIQYHMGIAVDMMYGANGSGAYSDDAANALINYFGMDGGLHLEYAPSPINETWKSLLRTELEAGRPMYYHGFGSGGHAFNLDGYQGTDYFHFNWGWSGSYNGYFYLDNLNPGGNTFTEGQGAIVGIQPTGNYPYYCNSTDTLRSLNGTIEDGSGPTGSYIEDLNCGWLIIPEDSIVSITLTFHRFDLENGSDFLTVYDGIDEDAPVIGVFTGSDAPQQAVSTGGAMFIKFTTNNAINQGGWFASYSSTRATYCSGLTILTAPEGSLNDGSGTYNYHENSLCKYKILPDSAESITLHFDQFDTFDENDFLMIFNLENNDLLQTLSGTSIPGDLFFNTGKLLLMFHSDAVNNGQGWSFSYTSSNLTGVNDLLSESNLRVFPNPANQSIRITANNLSGTGCLLTLSDMKGNQLISVNRLVNNKKLDENLGVENIPEGVYLLRIVSDEMIINRKVIIRH
ncbi:MAG: C10 family peptidase [Bacteroidales bacterium]|nr:C10 family peptidase [Bacteroidales bacterium]